MKDLLPSKSTNTSHSKATKAIIFYEMLMGLAELLFGTSLILFGEKTYVIYREARINELLEDPHDLMIQITDRLMPFVIEYRWYVAFFLVALGAIKSISGIGMLKEKPWGLYTLIAIVLFLLPFELYEMINQPSISRIVFFSINLMVSVYLLKYRSKLMEPKNKVLEME